jgi:CDP-2,3-bis-(O-geranylgeranyl)-sn-glycerol synthase
MGSFRQFLVVATVDPFFCALFLILSFVVAGTAQTIWFRSRFSRKFSVPLDLGLTCRGRRIFGENKTVRGFVIMLPAAAGSFFILGLIAAHQPYVFIRIWPLSPSAFAFLGLCAGVGFMIGELPNSFLKRQLDIAPGEAPRHTGAKVLFFILDRFDSIIGMMLAVSLTVPTPWQTWLYLAIIGPVIHWFFSVILYWCGVKGRPA